MAKQMGKTRLAWKGTSEAESWLKKNNNPNPFAGNRFTKAKALSLVENLKACRCKVEVAEILKEPWRLKEEGGPYSATLVVTCKTDQQVSCVKPKIKSKRPDEFHLLNGKKFRVWWD
jgi:hypothetical protein